LRLKKVHHHNVRLIFAPTGHSIPRLGKHVFYVRKRSGSNTLLAT